MKKTLVLACFLFLLSCGDKSDNFSAPENGLDAGREFIQSSLKGKFNTARRYMLQTSENNYWLDKVSKDYNQYSEKDKTGYSNASINIMEVADVVPDSIVVIHYSNSYVKRPQKLKVIKYDGQWQVDFAYTFSGN